MTYEPLHHKYRPQTFADLVGQNAIAATLTNAILQDRIAPAYLLTGPRGTGKTSSARILAKSLNCLVSSVPTPTPCGTCDVCVGITKGATLDVIEIDAASNTGVDNIRELIERAQFAPVQCRYKVYVIDECHMLSAAAFNALLKTLEEPPDRVVFVLATTDPQRVLPTIISRCQRFDFRRIPLAAMVEHLKNIAIKEKINITDEAVQIVAQISQGGLRDAESLLDQLSLITGQVTVEKVWDLVGVVPEQDLMALLEAIDQGKAPDIITCVRHLMDRGREPLIVLQNLAAFYRDLLMAKTAPERGNLVALTQPTWEKLCEFAKAWDMNLILAAQKHLRDSEVQIKNTTQPRLWLEVTLLGLLPSALFSPAAPPELAARGQMTRQNMPLNPSVDASRQGTTAPPPPTAMPPNVAANPGSYPGLSPEHQERESPTPLPPEISPAAPQPSTTPTADSTGVSGAATSGYNLEEMWQHLLNYVQPRATQELLRQQGQLLGVDANLIRVGMRSLQLLKIVQSKVGNIRDAFQKAFNSQVEVRLEVIDNTQKTVPQDVSTSRQEHPPQPASNGHPLPSTDQPQNSAANHIPMGSQPQELPRDRWHETRMPPTSSASELRHPSPLTNGFEQRGKPEPDHPPQALVSEDSQQVHSAAQKLAAAFAGEIINIQREPGSFSPEATRSQVEISETSVREPLTLNLSSFEREHLERELEIELDDHEDEEDF